MAVGIDDVAYFSHPSNAHEEYDPCSIVFFARSLQDTSTWCDDATSTTSNKHSESVMGFASTKPPQDSRNDHSTTQRIL